RARRQSRPRAARPHRARRQPSAPHRAALRGGARALRRRRRGRTAGCALRRRTDLGDDRAAIRPAAVLDQHLDLADDHPVCRRAHAARRDDRRRRTCAQGGVGECGGQAAGRIEWRRRAAVRGVWTVVIVAQIALTTMLPVPLLGVGRDFTRKTPAGFPAEQFLTATLAMDPFDGVAATTDTVSAVPGARLEERYRQLADRLRQEPGVLGVTYADQMPVMRHQWGGIWMDPGPAAAHSERCVGGYCGAYVSVDPQFFEAIGVPVLRGRALTAADAEHRTRAVLVNEFFVEQVMGGRNPLGRRLRSSSTPEPTA